MPNVQQVMDDFLEFSMLFCSKKNKRLSILKGKTILGLNQSALYPLLIEEKKIYCNLRMDFTNTTVLQAKKNYS